MHWNVFGKIGYCDSNITMEAVLVLRSWHPGFKTRPDHWLNLILLAPGSTPQTALVRVSGHFVPWSVRSKLRSVRSKLRSDRSTKCSDSLTPKPKLAMFDLLDGCSVLPFHWSLKFHWSWKAFMGSGQLIIILYVLKHEITTGITKSTKAYLSILASDYIPFSYTMTVVSKGVWSIADPFL